MERDLLGIGEVSRASGLTVSALRFYDAAGLLVPAYVDPVSGYRRYRDDQVRTARVLANLRRVGLPLADMARVLDAATPSDAAAVLDRHLQRLEAGLGDARQVLSRVRILLDNRESTMSQVTVTVPAPDLAAALDRVRFAVSTDPDLPALGGVLVELGGRAVRLVATDRYRLAVGEAGGPVNDAEVAVLVPAAFLDDVRQGLDGAAGPVELTGTATGLSVVVDGVRHESGALEHDFPAYRSLIPGPRQHQVPLNLASVRAELSDEPGTVHRLTLDGITVGVDPAFLLQALAAAGSDQLVLELDGPVSPLAIRAAEDDELSAGFSLLMPVRLDA